MLARFSLYGFLKNLRFFDAFLILALLNRGLDFLAIGLLIAVKEVTVNICEVPSGAIADAFGRKRWMVSSMASYLCSFAILAGASSWWLLAAGMLFYGVGDAFRSGTHKALIYSWLRQQGRENERTKIYGYTRSWSKIGSALSALIGGVVLITSSDYQWMFWASMVPTGLNLINLATYPNNLDIPKGGLMRGLKDSWSHLLTGLKLTIERKSLQKLIAGSMVV